MLRLLPAFALLAILPACHSLASGNAVRVVEEPRSIAYCQELGEVQASVQTDEGAAFPGESRPKTGADYEAEDALTPEVLAKGGDTLYGVTTERDLGGKVTARGVAYFCDRANKPNDYKK